MNQVDDPRFRRICVKPAFEVSQYFQVGPYNLPDSIVEQYEVWYAPDSNKSHNIKLAIFWLSNNYADSIYFAVPLDKILIEHILSLMEERSFKKNWADHVS